MLKFVPRVVRDVLRLVPSEVSEVLIDDYSVLIAVTIEAKSNWREEPVFVSTFKIADELVD